MDDIEEIGRRATVNDKNNCRLLQNGDKFGD